MVTSRLVGSPADDTLSYGQSTSPGGAVPIATHLVLGLETRRPLAGSTHWLLDAVDEVVLARGSERSSRELTAGGRRGLEIAIPDPTMSSPHARLVREAGLWRLADAGSKNGTFLNQRPTTAPTVVRDGDLIEVGGTLLLTVEAPALPPSPLSDELRRDSAAARALRTYHPALRGKLADLVRVAASKVPVLVLGETGTGKELTARAVHAASGRRGSFVAINCGALPPPLVESELFGHCRGAFSHADRDHPGLVRRADGGTLFLDEVAELSEPSQVALLRLLQEGEVRSLGSLHADRVDVRVVAATHQDLAARVASGALRPDLYARLAGYTIALPPLRERRVDLGDLIATLLARVAGREAERVRLRRSAARTLFRYDFPLNIRELEHIVRSAVVLAGDEPISDRHLPGPCQPATPAPAAEPTLSEHERELRATLTALMREHDGNVSAVGRALGKAPVQIRRWARRLAIDIDSYRG
jgi:DNA-binding NtrC family response regulator